MRRSRMFIAVCLGYGISLAVGCLVSSVAMPAFWELERLKAIERGSLLVWNVAQHGPSVFASSSARAVYDDVAGYGALLALLSGWVDLSLGEAEIVGHLTAARMAFICVVATGPVSLFLMLERAAGVRVAAVGAVLLLTSPRWLHQTGVASETAVTVACWLLILAAYVRSIRVGADNGRSRCWAVLCAAALGFGLAIDVATLWIVPVVFVHYWMGRFRAVRRAATTGCVPAPAAALWAIGVTPVVVLGLTPQLWKGSARTAAQWLLSGVNFEFEPTLYAGELLRGVPFPAWFAPHWVVGTTPLVVLAFAATATWSWARSSRRRPVRQRVLGVERLMLLVLGCGLLAVWVSPAVLTRFPPRALAALPALCGLAAIGVHDASKRFVIERWQWRVVFAGSALAAAVHSWMPDTAGADYGVVVGGVRGVAESETFPVGDGSELGGIVHFIDAQGAARVSLDAVGVPKDYFSTLHQLGRMNTQVMASDRAGAEFVVRSGDQVGAAARVARAGQVLWSIAPR